MSPGLWKQLDAAGRDDWRALLKMLEDTPREKHLAREGILSDLKRLRPPEAVPVARSIASDAREGNMVRVAALELLGQIGDTSATPDVVRLLADGPARVRVEAAYTLARLGGQEAAAALMDVLKDERNEARAAAARALGKLRATSAVALLAERLERDRNLYVRKSAALALHRIATPAAQRALDRGLGRLGRVTRWRIRRWIDAMQ